MIQEQHSGPFCNDTKACPASGRARLTSDFNLKRLLWSCIYTVPCSCLVSWKEGKERRRVKLINLIRLSWWKSAFWWREWIRAEKSQWRGVAWILTSGVEFPDIWNQVPSENGRPVHRVVEWNLGHTGIRRQTLTTAYMGINTSPVPRWESQFSSSNNSQLVLVSTTSNILHHAFLDSDYCRNGDGRLCIWGVRGRRNEYWCK